MGPGGEPVTANYLNRYDPDCIPNTYPYNHR